MGGVGVRWKRTWSQVAGCRRRCRLLFIDELSVGLAPIVVEQLIELVQAIAADGTTVVLVEQSVSTALRLAERAVFMEKGQIRYEGPTAELLERPDILRAVFLSRPHRRREPPAPGADPVLRLTGLSKS